MAVSERKGAGGYGRQTRWMIAFNVWVVSALAIVLVVFVNYGVSEYSAGHDVRFDLTRSQWFKLEDSTKGIIRAVESPIHVYMVYGIDRRMTQAARKTWNSPTADSGLIEKVYRPLVTDMARSIESMLKEARVINRHLRVFIADADQAVDEPREWRRVLDLGPEQLLNHVVFFNPETKSKKAMSFYKMFDVHLGGPDPSRGHLRPTLRGDYIEQHLVHGVKAVMETKKSVVYVAAGHEEVEKPTFAAALQGDNFEIRSLSLGSRGAVPADCDLLVVLSPAREWLPQARRGVEEYFERGGRILITQGRYAKEEFRELLHGVGIELLPVQIGHSTHHDRRGGKYALYGIELLRPAEGEGPHPATAPSVQDRLPIYLGFSRGYRLMKDYERDRVTRWVLARSGDGGEPMPWIFDGRNWRQADERAKPPVGDYPLMLAAEKRAGGGRVARLIVAGSDDWLDTSFLTAGFNLANLDIVQNAVYWLTDREKIIAGTPRKFRGTLAALDDDKHRTFQLITVGILPAIILLLGLLVFLMRRR